MDQQCPAAQDGRWFFTATAVLLFFFEILRNFFFRHPAPLLLLLTLPSRPWLGIYMFELISPKRPFGLLCVSRFTSHQPGGVWDALLFKGEGGIPWVKLDVKQCTHEEMRVTAHSRQRSYGVVSCSGCGRPVLSCSVWARASLGPSATLNHQPSLQRSPALPCPGLLKRPLNKVTKNSRSPFGYRFTHFTGPTLKETWHSL